MNPFPYWHYRIPDISNLILLQVQNTENIYEKCNMANEIINTIWKASLHIYTDGSVDTKINVAGCSMFIPQLKYSKAIRLNNETSIFSAELTAILIALEWIEEVQPIVTCIFSDCLSAI